MSYALGQCTHFFFFVTANSLKSRMVSLEWQNALLKATRGQCKLVPVRCDSSELPPIMAQSLYIDLYSVGLDAAIAQIADVIQGQSTYQPPSQPFSNVCSTANGSDKDLTLEIKAKFYLEPIGSFLILIDNVAAEFEAKPVNEDPYKGGFTENIKLNTGVTTNGFLVTVFRGVTPSMPIRVQLKAKGTVFLQVQGYCTRSLMIDGKVYLPRSSHRAFLALAPLVRRRKHDG